MKNPKSKKAETKEETESIENNSQKKIYTIVLIFLFLGTLFLGVFIGIIIENIREGEQKKYGFHSVENIASKSSEIPVLSFQKIENGILSGKIYSGEARIIFPKEELHVIKNEEFQLSVLEILPMLKKIPSPENAKFVASKRGKKFYALDNPKAFLITAKNRIFFSSREDAIENGFYE